jgi:hypothetical protein
MSLNEEKKVQEQVGDAAPASQNLSDLTSVTRATTSTRDGDVSEYKGKEKEGIDSDRLVYRLIYLFIDF